MHTHSTGQPVRSCDPCKSHPCDFAFLTDQQLTSQALTYKDGFDSAWAVCMANHYATGVYIDAEVKMNNAYASLGRILDYVYTFKPSTFYDQLNSLLSQS
jgi:hypothetical protein